MKTSILTSLFFGIALNAFSQNTNTTGIGPTANNQAIPILGNAVVHQHSSVLNQAYTVSGISAPQSNLGGDHRCKTYELNQQHYQDRGIQNEFNLGYQQHAYQVTNYGVPKTAGVNEISVIFHVVHNPNNPAENVSNALIMQVFDDLAYHDYEGIALNHDERDRLLNDLGDKHCMILRNHGLLTTGATCADAWLRLFFLERACTMQIKALSGGSKLNMVPEDVVELVTDQGQMASEKGIGNLAWPALIRKLDKIDVSYKE